MREATVWPEDRPEAGGSAAAGVIAAGRLADARAEGRRLFADAVR